MVVEILTTSSPTALRRTSTPSTSTTPASEDKHEYTSKHKSKGEFDKEALKKKYFKKAKAQERAFLASLSDLDNDTDDDRSSSPSSDDESEKRREDKLTGICFVAKSISEATAPWPWMKG
jgi:hypothetical protein